MKRTCALALCLAGVHMAFAQTDIDELLHALDALERTGQAEKKTAPDKAPAVNPPPKAMVVPEEEDGEFGHHIQKSGSNDMRKLFVRRVRELMGLDGASPTNACRVFRREVGTIERDGRTVTLRARFPRETSFASLQREMESTVADLEKRFADCGFSPVAVSGNAYLNYVEDVGGIAVFLYADGDVPSEAYTMEASFALDFLAPHQTEESSTTSGSDVSRDADFSDRKAVEAMLAALGRSDFIVRKVKYRRQTARTAGEGSLPDEGVVGLDVGEARERRYEAMRFMNDFIHPCEDGFGWKEEVPEVSAGQARFVRLVREITGRPILPADAVPPFETLSEMRRRYHQPTKRISPTVVDWNVPVNAFRYFPHAPDSFDQSPYSSTLFACFSAACTRESLWNEMCALARDLERRFADCGFGPQEVEDGGYVNYRPNVGGIVIHLLSCRNGEEPVHMLVLHFSTRLFDWRCGTSWRDWKTERLLRNVLTRGMQGGSSVCAACVKRRLRDYCGNLDWMKGVPERGWFVRAFDQPVYERRGEKDDWRSVLRPAFAERTVSCFDEAVILEDLPLDVGGASVCACAVGQDADARRSEVAESFCRRFLQTGRQVAEEVPDVALCEICRGSSSWKK